MCPPCQRALCGCAGAGAVAPKDIQLIECVGEGSFGQVWRARYYGAVVAVKIFGSRQSIAATTDASSSSAEGAASGGTEHSDLKREALLMSQLRHPNGTPPLLGVGWRCHGSCRWAAPQCSGPPMLAAPACCLAAVQPSTCIPERTQPATRMLPLLQSASTWAPVRALPRL